MSACGALITEPGKQVTFADQSGNMVRICLKRLIHARQHS
jgi:hypothetical protein